MNSSNKKAVGALLIRGMHEALAHKHGEDVDARVTHAKVTVRSVDVVPPPEYRHVDIRKVRERLGLSQAVFASLIGASASTVRAWERGARRPSDMARRLIELAEREPHVFEADLVVAGEE